jgi:hypothetical protein
VVDGAVDGAVEPPEPREPPLPSMFGQFPEWVFGAVLPPVPVDGCVVAFGAGDPDGSAANTTAVPPATRRPMASATVAIVRRATPKGVPEAACVDGVGSAGGVCGGSHAGWSFKVMLVLLRGPGLIGHRWRIDTSELRIGAAAGATGRSRGRRRMPPPRHPSDRTRRPMARAGPHRTEVGRSSSRSLMGSG